MWLSQRLPDILKSCKQAAKRCYAHIKDYIKNSNIDYKQFITKKAICIAGGVLALVIITCVGIGINDSDYSESTISTNTAEHKKQDKYLPCIIVDNAKNITYFDQTLDEFISNYNRIVDNDNDVTDVVKELMKLNDEPPLIYEDDETDEYIVTNPVVATNNLAPQITVTTLHGKKNVQSVKLWFYSKASANDTKDSLNPIFRAVAALTAPTNSLSGDEWDTMIDNSKTNKLACAYYKGLYFGYHEILADGSLRPCYRLSAFTEKEYNQMVNSK